MNSPTPASTERIQVVDALRGFAIVAILLLHNLEHFDVWYLPEGFPSWLISLDKGMWDTMFFLFSGKAYGIFAVLFGFTFYIMQHNQAKKGKDFRLPRGEENNNPPILFCLLTQYCVKNTRRCAASSAFFALSWAKSLRKMGRLLFSSSLTQKMLFLCGVFWGFAPER